MKVIVDDANGIVVQNATSKLCIYSQSIVHKTQSSASNPCDVLNYHVVKQAMRLAGDLTSQLKQSMDRDEPDARFKHAYSHLNLLASHVLIKQSCRPVGQKHTIDRQIPDMETAVFMFFRTSALTHITKVAIERC